MTTLAAPDAPPVDVAYQDPHDKFYDVRRRAEAALIEGRETIVHSHASFAQVDHHRHCDWYVLDWHDDPPAAFAQMRQIVVIECPPIDGDV